MRLWWSIPVPGAGVPSLTWATKRWFSLSQASRMAALRSKRRASCSSFSCRISSLRSASSRSCSAFSSCSQAWGKAAPDRGDICVPSTHPHLVLLVNPNMVHHGQPWAGECGWRNPTCPGMDLTGSRMDSNCLQRLTQPALGPIPGQIKHVPGDSPTCPQEMDQTCSRTDPICSEMDGPKLPQDPSQDGHELLSGDGPNLPQETDLSCSTTDQICSKMD